MTPTDSRIRLISYIHTLTPSKTFNAEQVERVDALVDACEQEARADTLALSGLIVDYARITHDAVWHSKGGPVTDAWTAVVEAAGRIVGVDIRNGSPEHDCPILRAAPTTPGEEAT
jgi:hypothetical protein